jgi:hypothetical protein
MSAIALLVLRLHNRSIVVSESGKCSKSLLCIHFSGGQCPPYWLLDLRLLEETSRAHVVTLYPLAAPLASDFRRRSNSCYDRLIRFTQIVDFTQFDTIMSENCIGGRDMKIDIR